MPRTMLTSRVHRATVTAADPAVGRSVPLDQDLLAAAGLLPGERVSVVDVTNGGRLEAYLSAAERAAAHRPRVVVVDGHNRIADPGSPLAELMDIDMPAAETDPAAALDALLQAES